jgi:hypothetical protein
VKDQHSTGEHIHLEIVSKDSSSYSQIGGNAKMEDFGVSKVGDTPTSFNYNTFVKRNIVDEVEQYKLLDSGGSDKSVDTSFLEEAVMISSNAILETVRFLMEHENNTKRDLLLDKYDKPVIPPLQDYSYRQTI